MILCVGTSGLKMKRCVEQVCKVLLLHEAELNELDREGGDGDCGATFKRWALGACACVCVCVCVS